MLFKSTKTVNIILPELLSLVVAPTAFCPWPLTLNVNSTWALVMNHMHAKGRSQRSFGSKVRVETNARSDRRTDGRREGIALPDSLMRSVIMSNSENVWWKCVVNWTCRCQRERADKQACRSCEQLHCLGLRRRTRLVPEFNARGSHTASWQGLGRFIGLICDTIPYDTKMHNVCQTTSLDWLTEAEKKFNRKNNDRLIKRCVTSNSVVCEICSDAVK